MQEYLNCYAVEFRGPNLSRTSTYFIVAETLESAIPPAKEALAREYGSEATGRSEVASVNEVARGVILPVKKAAKKKG